MKSVKRCSILLLFLGVTWCSMAQSVLDHRLDGTEKGKPLLQLLDELEAKYPVRCYYLRSWLEPILIEKSYQDIRLQEALDEILLGTDLSYVMEGEHALIFVRDTQQARMRASVIQSATRAQKQVDKLTIGQASAVKKNARFIVAGTVKDAESGEPLVGASILVTDLKTGATTDPSGHFEFQVAAGEHILSVTYLNHEEKLIELGLYKDAELTVALEEQATMLEEVIVSDVAAREATTSRVGQTLISIKELKRAPSLLGEVDLIRQIQVQPGVTTAGEAASGFNVRGGGVDQNLILYDGTPIFNSSHAFGFFSTFNANAVREVTFNRSGIAAEYGGRSSSVLDIRSREGDYDKWNGSGGVGLISSNLMLNGPLQKGKTSLAVSGRTTYSDWLINTIKTNYVDLQNSTVLFYDATLKLAHQFNRKTKLTFSGYASQDQFRLQGDTTYRWDNRAASMRLDHQFTDNLSGAVTASVGSYGYEVKDDSPLRGFSLKYRITYPSLKLDFLLLKGRHKITFGNQFTYYLFNPGTLVPTTKESTVATIQMEKQYSLENALYVGDAFHVNEKIFVEAGLRFSAFAAMGPATVNEYQAGVPKSVATITNMRNYSAGELIKLYTGLEPRLAMRYSLRPDLSVKASYHRMYQYLHLVTNTTAIMPIDIWQPSGYYFLPQSADQVSLGLFGTSKDKRFEWSVEGYYKLIHHLLDFKDGARLILNPHLETDLLQGEGRAYGIETSAAKTTGRLTGSISYTYSRSLRTIAGPTDQESINKGKEYPSNFDQPHILNLAWKYSLSRRYFFTGGFTYHTGRPVTLPVSVAVVDHTIVSDFSDRNAYRIPDYHRLDLALVIEGNHRRKKFWDGTWTISVYNVYGRKNPYTVFFKEGSDGILRPYQLSIIGTPLPSLSYSFKF